MSEFEIESIIGHEMTDNVTCEFGRYFLIKWAGYEDKDNLFMEEKEIGCNEALINYCAEHNLPLQVTTEEDEPHKENERRRIILTAQTKSLILLDRRETWGPSRMIASSLSSMWAKKSTHP